MIKTIYVVIIAAVVLYIGYWFGKKQAASATLVTSTNPDAAGRQMNPCSPVPIGWKFCKVVGDKCYYVKPGVSCSNVADY